MKKTLRSFPILPGPHDSSPSVRRWRTPGAHRPCPGPPHGPRSRRALALSTTAGHGGVTLSSAARARASPPVTGARDPPPVAGAQEPPLARASSDGDELPGESRRGGRGRAASVAGESLCLPSPMPMAPPACGRGCGGGGRRNSRGRGPAAGPAPAASLLPPSVGRDLARGGRNPMCG
jgi:hypothetical protein